MFTADALAIDPAKVSADIEKAIQIQVRDTLRRKGAVLGLSGGVDSSVVAALSVRALGRENVLGLLMPDRDSSEDALRLGKTVADHLGIDVILEDITPALVALGCYSRQIQAIQKIFPEYGEGYRCKVTLPPLLESDRLSISRLTIESPEGERKTARMPGDVYLHLIAATNFKQRTRKAMEYFHADRLRYAVAGTPNRLELDQGFFVKQGDGVADIKPIGHLYKTQVYALAEHLGIPEEIRRRPPTTDTFSLPQGQDEFYFALSYDKLDLCLYAHNHGVSAAEAAPVLGFTEEQVARVFKDIEAKRRATRYQHTPPLFVEPVNEV